MFGEGLIRFFQLRREAREYAKKYRAEQERRYRLESAGFRRELHFPSGEWIYVGGRQSGYWTVLRDGTMRRHRGPPPARSEIEVAVPPKLRELFEYVPEKTIVIQHARLRAIRKLIPAGSADSDLAWRDVTIFLESPPLRRPPAQSTS